MSARCRHRFARPPGNLLLLVALAAMMCGCEQIKSVTNLKPITRTRPAPPPTPPPVDEPVETSVALQVANTPVEAKLFQHRTPRPTMINVHDDENTSVEAGRENVLHFGGRVIELVHSGQRHVSFELNGTNYLFDPNRIFSEAGIRATLQRSGAYSPEAHRAVADFANHLLSEFRLNDEPLIIALHNTSEGSYSIRSYTPGGMHPSAAADVYINPGRNRYDFFYVTTRILFEALRAQGYNVILQDNVRAPDDGSLSVYFARQGIPYVNVEARIGQREIQVEMLESLREVLRELHMDPAIRPEQSRALTTANSY